jgi:hypothetical protein
MHAGQWRVDVGEPAEEPGTKGPSGTGREDPSWVRADEARLRLAREEVGRGVGGGWTAAEVARRRRNLVSVVGWNRSNAPGGKCMLDE